MRIREDRSKKKPRVGLVHVDVCSFTVCPIVGSIVTALSRLRQLRDRMPRDEIGTQHRAASSDACTVARYIVTFSRIHVEKFSKSVRSRDRRTHLCNKYVWTRHMAAIYLYYVCHSAGKRIKIDERFNFLPKWDRLNFDKL